jgi:hypothetical protein
MFAGMTLYAESESPLTRVARMVPGPTDVGFAVRFVPNTLPFAVPLEGVGFAFRPRSTRPDIANALSGKRWHQLRQSYLACSGTSAPRDPLWGSERALPEAQISTPTFRSLTEPDTRASVTVVWFRDPEDLVAMQRQLDTHPVVPCFTSALGELTSGHDRGELSPAPVVTVSTLNDAKVVAAVTNTRRAGDTHRLYTAVVISDHVMATVVVLTARGETGESRFRDVVTYLSQSVTGERPAAV